MKIEEMWFDIYKDGVNTNRQVAILYSDIKNRREKLDRLINDYPTEEGYELILSSIKTRQTG